MDSTIHSGWVPWTSGGAGVANAGAWWENVTLPTWRKCDLFGVMAAR